jgi:hypothetical protein
MKDLVTLVWMLGIPVAYIYMTIWAMWWPRRSIEHGRIFAMAFVIYAGWMIYAGFGSDVFDAIQRKQW